MPDFEEADGIDIAGGGRQYDAQRETAQIVAAHALHLNLTALTDDRRQALRVPAAKPQLYRLHKPRFSPIPAVPHGVLR